MKWPWQRAKVENPQHVRPHWEENRRRYREQVEAARVSCADAERRLRELLEGDGETEGRS